MFKIFKKSQEEKMLEERGKGRLYKAINLSSIIGLFITVGVLVLMVTTILPWNSNLVGIIAALAILCIGCNLALPWIVKLEKKEFIKLSYVFLGLVALFTILWIVCDILIIAKYKAIRDAINANLTETETARLMNGIVDALNFIKITVFLSLQFSIATFIATYVTRFKKSNLVLQVIAYICFFIVDIWVSLFMFSLNAYSNFEMADLSLSDILYLNQDLLLFLVRKGVIVVVALAFIYVAISKSILNRLTLSDRVRNMASEEIAKAPIEKAPANVSAEPVQPQEKSKEDATEKLEKLKEMLDKNLITQEEFDAKKAEILKDM